MSLSVTAVASGPGAGVDATTVLQIRSAGFRRYFLPLGVEDLWFSMVAAENTTVAILGSTSRTNDGCTGPPITSFNLSRFEIETFPSGSYFAACIESSEPISIFAGKGCGEVPVQGVNSNPSTCSHLYEQLLPESLLGREYLLPNLLSQVNQAETYIVTGTIPDTIVTVTSGKTNPTSHQIQLHSGQSYQVTVDPDSSSFVECSQVCSVMGFHQRFNVAGPFMFNVPPLKEQAAIQLPSAVLTNAAGYGIPGEVTIIRTVGESTVTNMGDITGFMQAATNPTLEIATVTLEEGMTEITSSGPFTAIFHGQNGTDTFGTFASANNGKNDSKFFTLYISGITAFRTSRYCSGITTDITGLWYNLFIDIFFRLRLLL